MATFERNRETLLRALGAASSQITEEEVQIASFDVIAADGTITKITTQELNAFGRFYVQFVIGLAHPCSKPTELSWTQHRAALTELVFAENWDDRETVNEGRGRPLLKALSTAVRIEHITWK